MNGTDADPTGRRLLGRRALLGAGGLGVIGAGVGAGAAVLATAPTDATRPARSRSIPFHGTHQAGILDPRQVHARLAAFDFGARTDRGRAAALLLRWSSAAERLTRGEPVGEELSPPGSRATDTGPALGSGPASLTLTFGLGPTFFDRVGMAAARPGALAQLPDFPDDELDPARGGGDLFVQIAADDPLVTVHALRTLQRLAQGEAKVRWTMAGFTSSPEGTPAGGTHRNLMGHLDGTANPDPADPDRLARIVVSDPAAPAWLTGGSYLVVRRIRMLLDHWDTLPPAHRDQAVGRRASDGAPLSGGAEHTPADLAASRPDGVPVIATNAHIRLAAPATTGGATMLRRGWSYHDGLRPDGTPDAGMLFLAWQADPRTGFVPVQHRLARGDALARYTVHEASALFVAPGGAAPGQYVGQALMEG
ncbi:iron uptake transporter deferrochelatase/peroxidase subunit [Streptomyces sp. NBC_00435]|uniref:iron uptake transporter deferrochelatase/peroxidase subunit n=1 Tax=Streptomyces sp. NBC_00435 TaxID=2903649 RepID=UPI002E1C7ADF